MIKGWGVLGLTHESDATLTKEQKDAIAKDPRPVKVIAAEYGITTNKVYSIARRSRIPDVQELHKTKRRFTDDQIRAIRADKRKQKTIAAEYHIVQGTVWAIKKRKIYRDVQELRDDRI